MELELYKMKTALQEQVQYKLVSEEATIEMNPLIGKKISMQSTAKFRCQNCRRFVKKLFAQGFCYDCFMKSAAASPCIINPELCEGHLGKGRDPEWEKANHVQPHFVYLAVASAVKVGVTRFSQVPTRWIDQGASYAIKIAETPYRKLAGDIEVALKECFTDKTSWQAMLKNEIGDFDLVDEKWQLESVLPADLAQYMTDDDEIVEINYPVLEFPKKVTSISFDKTPLIEGTLIGIKGQYLILDGGRVLNIRKHDGYYIDFNHE
jgi:hypothetical protein